MPASFLRSRRGLRRVAAVLAGVLCLLFTLPAEATHNGCSAYRGSPLGDKIKCSYVATGTGFYYWAGSGTWKITVKRGRMVVKTIKSTDSPLIGEQTGTKAKDIVTVVIMSGQGVLAAGDND